MCESTYFSTYISTFATSMPTLCLLCNSLSVYLSLIFLTLPHLSLPLPSLIFHSSFFGFSLKTSVDVVFPPSSLVLSALPSRLMFVFLFPYFPFLLLWLSSQDVCSCHFSSLYTCSFSCFLTSYLRLSLPSHLPFVFIFPRLPLFSIPPFLVFLSRFLCL